MTSPPVLALLAAVGFAVRHNIFRLGFRHDDDPTLAAAALIVSGVVVVMRAVGGEPRTREALRVVSTLVCSPRQERSSA